MVSPPSPVARLPFGAHDTRIESGPLRVTMITKAQADRRVIERPEFGYVTLKRKD